MFDKTAIADYLATLAINNGDAYRNGRDVAKAMKAAQLEFMKEFREMMDEAVKTATQEVNNHWFEEEIRAAEKAAYTDFFARVDAGETVQVQPHVYEHYLDLLPPVSCWATGFLFAEGDDRDSQGKRLVYQFTKNAQGHFCQRRVI